MNQIAKTTFNGETDFLRRHNNKTIHKQKRIRSIQLRGLHIVMVFVVLFIASFAAYKITLFLLTWEKLNVKTFLLVNKPNYHAQRLEGIVKQFHGNILSLSFTEMRAELMTLKEVKEVYLSRQLPSTVEIKFLLRKPAFQVAINGKYNIIDMEGVVLYTSKKSSKQLIRIYNVKTAQLERLAPYLPELSRIRDSIDYISLQEPYGVALKLKGKPELFYPGETNFAYKINYYLKLRQRPLLKKYTIKSVDLRFKDRFYFEYETEVNN